MGHDGKGDFNLDNEGRVCYGGKGAEHKYIFIGPRVVAPRLFAGQPVAKFHLFVDFLYKKRLNDKGVLDRVYGIEHKGYWLDIGNLEGLKQAENFLLANNLLI
jgi:MurNAc alpha-1-phosphate uridylyltransferase